jgi:adenylate kinase family enzyme
MEPEEEEEEERSMMILRVIHLQTRFRARMEHRKHLRRLLAVRSATAIALLGGPGSGKTSIARRLTEQLNCTPLPPHPAAATVRSSAAAAAAAAADDDGGDGDGDGTAAGDGGGDGGVTAPPSPKRDASPTPPPPPPPPRLVHLSTRALIHTDLKTLKRSQDSKQRSKAEALTSTLATGALVDPYYVCELVHRASRQKAYETGGATLLLDNFPLTETQLEHYEGTSVQGNSVKSGKDSARQSPPQIRLAILLECSEETMLSRTKSEAAAHEEEYSEEATSTRVKRWCTHCRDGLVPYLEGLTAAGLNTEGKEESVIIRVVRIATEEAGIDGVLTQVTRIVRTHLDAEDRRKKELWAAAHMAAYRNGQETSEK